MSISIKGNCFACGMCVDVCPFGAIDYDHKDKSGGYKGVVINDDLCRNCLTCVEECPAGCLIAE